MLTLFLGWGVILNTTLMGLKAGFCSSIGATSWHHIISQPSPLPPLTHTQPKPTLHDTQPNKNGLGLILAHFLGLDSLSLFLFPLSSLLGPLMGLIPWPNFWANFGPHFFFFFFILKGTLFWSLSGQLLGRLNFYFILKPFFPLCKGLISGPNIWTFFFLVFPSPF